MDGERLLAISLMMVLFLHAARLAMVTFDPFLSSRPLAECDPQVASRASSSWAISTTHIHPSFSIPARTLFS